VTKAEEPTQEKLDAVLKALGLLPETRRRRSPARSLATTGPIAVLAARAMGAACPPILSERERRILANADQLAHDTTHALAFVMQAHLYLSFLACSWAKNASLSSSRRDLALLAAIGLAAVNGQNAREALGVDDRLKLLALDPSLDADVRAAVELVGGDHAELLKRLEWLFDKLMGSGGAKRPTTRRNGRRRRRAG